MLSLGFATRFDQITIKHASQHDPFGPSLLHKIAHPVFGRLFFWNLSFPTKVRWVVA